MATTLFTHWLSERQISAICWTLIHSLWIGLVVSALAGLVITVTHRSSAHLRYQLLCACLVLFVTAMGFVYYQEQRIVHSLPSPGKPIENVAPIADIVVQRQSAVAVQKVSVSTRLLAFINANSNWIVTIWLLFFVLKSLRMASGLLHIYRIRSYKVYAPAEEWQQKVWTFGKRLGIRQAVALVQSQRVNVPVTVGILKPVILVPIGLLTQLPTEQIDTILWHELAHIWRRDYLMNLLQCMVETIFFFNPALLWVSALIREEREICCDDIVLAQTSAKRHYLEALLAFQDYAYQPTLFAMPLGFRSQQLMDRLKRMVTQENRRLSMAEKIALLSGLVLLLASAFVSKVIPEGAQWPKTFPKKSIIVRNSVPIETSSPQKIDDKPGLLVAKSNLTKARPIMESTPEPLVLADSNRIFTSILFVNTNHDRANREMMVKDDRGNRYHLKVVDSQLVALDVNDRTIPTADLGQHQTLLERIDQALAEKQQQKQAHIDAAIAHMKAEREQQVQRDKDAYRTKQAKMAPGSLNGKPEGAVPNDNKLGKVFNKPAKPDYSPADSSAKVQRWEKKKLPAPPDIRYDQERVRGVIDALVAEKIVASSSDVDWFGLSTDEFIVNGQKQPDNLQQRLKAQFGIKSNYGLYYGPVKMIGTGIFLDKEDMSR
ncbi:M56 family metallopeptidase [Spirosoma aerolatum]|uniref:M56 family metallopeptidase n=1 Tax=Spirosoma aerolatum TaxID=1211326 RepID=UPI0009AD502A|nr:M56 family metallopeptidase [Spirosoma aerolatum]